MRYALAIFIFFHGLIHLPGFAKAFKLAQVSQLTQYISKAGGILWLQCALLLVATAIVILLKNNSWWMFAAPAIIFSQYLLFTSWQDAKYGTIANAVILLATIVGYANWSFTNKYNNEVKKGLVVTSTFTDSALTEADILALPEAVKKYIRYTGAIGKPKVKNFKIEFSGQIRQNNESDWMPFTSEQYNFQYASKRLFFMKAVMKHLPVSGFHCFKNGEAFMDIRLLSLFKVEYKEGKAMGIAETVTFFNDMCCMAPATLIDRRIIWCEAGSNKVNASFTNNGITVSAWLYFNEKGELINFISDDRYTADENNVMKKVRWSTPLTNYKDFNGHRLASYAEAIYSYPGGDLCYGNFRLDNIEYNCKEQK